MFEMAQLPIVMKANQVIQNNQLVGHSLRRLIEDALWESNQIGYF